jgi:hypothetical protein
MKTTTMVYMAVSVVQIFHKVGVNGIYLGGYQKPQTATEDV